MAGFFSAFATAFAINPTRTPLYLVEPNSHNLGEALKWEANASDARQ